MLPGLYPGFFRRGDHFDFRLVPFAEVLADQPDENGRYRYPLSEQDRADLPRLRDMFLGILMPANPGDLIVNLT